MNSVVERFGWSKMATVYCPSRLTCSRRLAGNWQAAGMVRDALEAAAATNHLDAAIVDLSLRGEMPHRWTLQLLAASVSVA